MTAVDIGQVAQGLLDNEMTDIDDHAVAFRHPDKAIRRHLAQFAILPADQRFDTHRYVAIEHLRLVHQREFAIRQRLRQRLLDIGSFHQFVTQLAGKYVETVFDILGLVHRRIRRAEQRFKGISICRIMGDTDTGAHDKVVVFDVVRRCQCLLTPLLPDW